MARHPRKPPLGGPPAVPVHDDGDVPGEQFGNEEGLELAVRQVLELGCGVLRHGRSLPRRPDIVKRPGTPRFLSAGRLPLYRIAAILHRFFPEERHGGRSFEPWRRTCSKTCGEADTRRWCSARMPTRACGRSSPSTARSSVPPWAASACGLTRRRTRPCRTSCGLPRL